MKQLRGTLSGICQPEYVLDIPGGAGKIPVGPAWAEHRHESHWRLCDYQGSEHSYCDTPDQGIEDTGTT